VELWVIFALGGGLLVLTLVPGVYLWWPSRDDPVKRTDLGLALVAGATVAFSIFALQALFDNRIHELEERREDARRQADRNTSALNFIGLYDDLSFIDLSGRDLPGLYLRGKTLRDARFSRSNLTGAVIVGGNATRADFARADLTSVRADGARLTEANFEEADLTDAVLVGTDLRGASLRGAILDGADLGESGVEFALFEGARYNGETVFPRDMRVPTCAAGQTCVLPSS